MENFKNYLAPFVVVISIVTIFSGLLQIVMPTYVLQLIGATHSPLAGHLFAIVGLFMALFGGLMLHTVYSARTSRVAILWCSFQKLGAFVAVSVGVLKGLFAFIAIGVALFDLISGILFIVYLKQRRE